MPLIAGRRYPWVFGVMIGGLLLATVSLGVSSAPVPAAASHGWAVNQVDLGKALFQAKGCATCNTNRRAAQGGLFTSEGPDLTALKLPPDYLARWRENPASIRQETSIPNLGLSGEEIQALAAYHYAPGD